MSQFKQKLNQLFESVVLNEMVELFYDQDGKLKKIDEIKDFPGAFEFYKNRIEFLRPRNKDATYQDKRDWYGAKEDLQKLKDYYRKNKKRLNVN